MEIKLGKKIIGSTLVPFTIDLADNPMWLIVGSSGSGKSYLTKMLLLYLLQLSDLEIFICDFKNSHDYDGILKEDHYATGADCIQLMDAYYSRYKEIKEKDLEIRTILIFDEWAAFCLWSDQYDKKINKRMLNQFSEILMMGRKIGNNGGSWIIAVLQRPDSTYFGSARENFFVKIVMKDVNKSIRVMLDLKEEDIPTVHTPITGHGICVMDDKTIPFIVPKYDEQAMNEVLRRSFSEV